MGVMLALSMRNHVQSNISRLGWSLMLRGALFQYNRHPAPASTGKAHMTKLEAFTGRTWDASTMIGEVGQGCWVATHGNRKNLIEPVMEAAIYVHPSDTSGGHVVALLRNCSRTIVAHATMIYDRAQKAAALTRSTLQGS